MAVIVEEMMSEMAGATAPAPVSAGGSASAGPARDVNMDRLVLAMRRREHRLERLWAD